MTQSNEAILVAARLRPPAETTTCGMDEIVVEVTSASTVRIKNGSQYAYDKVFAVDCDQDTVFESIGKRIVDGCLEGYNGTIFAYGQTGSGKTYTMLGPPGGQDVIDAQPHLRGLIPRAIEYLFRKLQGKSEQAGAVFTYTVKCTFSQLYNENFYDLLSADTRRVIPRAAKNGTMYLAGATEHIVFSTDDVTELLNQGLANRRVAETAMNQKSSRSHAIFTLELTTKLAEDGIVNVRRSILNLVDLAGSERQRDTETNSKSRVKEACSINSSLLILGRVIRELADPDYREGVYVPYRDSELTYLLKDSLGGNARTVFIVTVHANKRFAEETISALRFAQDVKKVRNVAAVNEDLSGENVNALKTEIIRLKDQLRRQPEITREDLVRLQEEVALWRTRAVALEDVVRTKSIQLDKCRGQLRMRDFSIRIFHRSSVPIEVKQAIMNWQQKFDELMADYSSDQNHGKGDLVDPDVYRLSDRAEKAEEEVKRLREKLQRLEQEKEHFEYRSSLLKEQFDDVERRVSVWMSPVGSPKSAARARRERRMTRFTLSPSRCVPQPVSPADSSCVDAFAPERDDSNGQNVVEEPNEQLVSKEGAALLADIRVNQLEQVLNDREELLRRVSQLTIVCKVAQAKQGREPNEQLVSKEGAALLADIRVNQLEQVLNDREELLRRYESEENEKLISFAEKIESLEAEKGELTDEISTLREQVKTLEPANAEMRSELITTKQHTAELAKERDSLLAKERELNAELRRKNDSLHECRERINELSARLEACAACEGNLRKVNAELKEKKADVMQEINALKDERRVLLSKVTEAQQRLIQCSGELNEAREQLRISEEKLKGSSMTVIHNAETLERKDMRIGELEAEIAKLQSEIEDERKGAERVIKEASVNEEKAKREFAALTEALIAKLQSEIEDERKGAERVIKEASVNEEKAKREFAALTEALMNVEVDTMPQKRRRSCFGGAMARVNSIAESMHRRKCENDSLREERDKLIADKERVAEEMGRLNEERQKAERDLEAVMSDGRSKTRTNLLERYRQKCLLLEEENRRLLEESDRLRSLHHPLTDASVRNVAKASSSTRSVVKVARQACQANSSVPTHEEKENIVPKQRRRRTTRTLQYREIVFEGMFTHVLAHKQFHLKAQESQAKTADQNWGYEDARYAERSI
ncbi:Kinesin-like protein KIF15-A [Toxocara canis]|uniref:Kinesin-like protein KIF15-A n=1 Tax=Toxocara canis TaxID=6265 RepID=A0A0B2VXX2_TOXCA|nr:Kinesin-like protein KIF15-A [Toxocara canis]